MLAVPGALVAMGIAYLAALGAAERDRRELALLQKLDLGPNRPTRWRNDGRQIELRNDASRQMLEHLALETVVIGRVTRAARNIGSVARVLVSRRRRHRMRVLSLMLRGMIRCHRVDRDPWQETQRRPGQRDQGVRCDPRAPAAALRVAFRRPLQRMRWRHEIEEALLAMRWANMKGITMPVERVASDSRRAWAGSPDCRYGRITPWK